MIELKVNGTPRHFEGDPELPLLWFLREELNLPGTRYGCGAALCGCCTVHVGGEATRSCSITMSELNGAAVTTIEGLSADGPHALQTAWIELQVPRRLLVGQLCRPRRWLANKPKPTDEDIDKTMAGISGVGPIRGFVRLLTGCLQQKQASGKALRCSRTGGGRPMTSYRQN
jgi:isoquinoline 1-oxidoreductase alpha subunit